MVKISQKGDKINKRKDHMSLKFKSPSIKAHQHLKILNNLQKQTFLKSLLWLVNSFEQPLVHVDVYMFAPAL